VFQSLSIFSRNAFARYGGHAARTGVLIVSSLVLPFSRGSGYVRRMFQD